MGRIMNTVDNQYTVKNVISIFNLMVAASRDQLRLKTDDKVMISLVAFLLIILRAPVAADRRMKIEMRDFFRYRTKKEGAIFCQVNNIKILFQVSFFVTLIYHG
jgi:hypothetical protein